MAINNDFISQIYEAALDAAIKSAFSKYEDLIQEGIIDADISEDITETVAELLADYIESIVNYHQATNPAILETDEFYKLLAESATGFGIGVASTPLYEFTLSPQVRRKIKKALKYGAIGAAGLGTLGAAAWAATHPEQVKQFASELGDKASNVIDSIRQKVSALVGSGTSTAAPNTAASTINPALHK